MGAAFAAGDCCVDQTEFRPTSETIDAKIQDDSDTHLSNKNVESTLSSSYDHEINISTQQCQDTNLNSICYCGNKLIEQKWTAKCICNRPFEQLLAEKCYHGYEVYCDKCRKMIDPQSIAYHCSNHEHGYDLCEECASNYICCCCHRALRTDIIYECKQNKQCIFKTTFKTNYGECRDCFTGNNDAKTSPTIKNEAKDVPVLYRKLDHTLKIIS